MSVVEANEHSTEIKNILNQEISDSRCKCYTGRMSRLINCLNGFDERVTVTISDTEQIAYVISVVEKELEEAGEYSAEKHRELVQRELLDRRYPSEVIEVWIENIE